VENSESRMEAALRRLEQAAASLDQSRLQGSFDMGDEGNGNGLAAENVALKKELAALQEKYDALKWKAETVSGRLDNSIGQLSALLERS